MNIKFLPFDRRKEKTSLRAFIYHRGQEYRVSVGESVIMKYWSEAKGRCKLVREYKEAAFVNKRIDDLEKILSGIVTSYGLVTPTERQVRDDFKQHMEQMNIDAGGVAHKMESQYLVNFARSFADEAIRHHRTRTGYITTIHKLEEYEKHTRSRLRFIDIDMNFYNHFHRWMTEGSYMKKDKEYYYSKNYIGGLFKNITVFMNEAHSRGLHNFTGYRDKKFRVESEQTDSIYLTLPELEKIFNLNFTEDMLVGNGFDARPQNLKRAIFSLNEERDRFLIGCFTALRHSDYSRLESLHFSDDIIAIWTQKKDKKVYIPMHHLLRKILLRRGNVLPEPISDQKHNDQIKVIGRLAGIDGEVLLTKTRGGARENIVGKKYEFITSHTARRSGATNMYLAGIDVKFIQDILGHAKVEQTIRYIKVSAEENAKRLQAHPYFTGKN
ncbi:MAG: site-specific integrase [Prevotella sp.]|nr:site-specific integrase [Prevotella sp.]